MADLKEYISYSDPFERTDFSSIQQQLHQTQLKGQFMRPLPNPLTPQQPSTLQQASMLPQAQVPAKRQFISPFPSEALHTSLAASSLFPTPTINIGISAAETLPEEQVSLTSVPMLQPFASVSTATTIEAPYTPSALPQQLPIMPPTPLAKFKLKKQKKSKTKMTRGKRIRRWFAIYSILTVIAVIIFSQANGVAGAWAADTMRGVLGPTITAQIESWYLGLSDTTHQLQYNLDGSQVNAPWTVSTATPLPTATIPANVVRL